jgi:hypothetical protein
MVGVVMGYVDALHVADGTAESFQGMLQLGEGFGRVHSRIEKGHPPLVKKGVDVDVLQPKGHGKRDAVKAVGDFLHKWILLLK